MRGAASGAEGDGGGGGQRVLLGEEPGRIGLPEHRWLRRPGEAKARSRASGLPAGAVAEGGHSSGSNEAEVADEGRGGDLRDAQDDRGTGVWTDQTGAWLSPVPIAGAGEGAGGVGAGVPDAQHFEDASDLLWIVFIQAGSNLAPGEPPKAPTGQDFVAKTLSGGHRSSDPCNLYCAGGQKICSEIFLGQAPSRSGCTAEYGQPLSAHF